MRILEDDEYDNMSRETLTVEFERIGENYEINDLYNAHNKLKDFHRCRSLAFWHDTSSVSNSSHLLVMLACVYDVALFYSDEEYNALTGKFFFLK